MLTSWDTTYPYKIFQQWKKLAAMGKASSHGKRLQQWEKLAAMGKGWKN
jgi:hypothetical protein